MSCPAPNGTARLRLLCFPHAGGSASIFGGWHRQLPAEIELSCVQLPGRDGRRGDPPLTDFDALVAALADALRWHLDVPLVFFGHSMGALIAFELARELRRRRLPGPAHLCVSAHRAPHLSPLNPGERPLHRLPDDEFIAELQRRYGTTPELAESAELAELFLPLLRADLALCETYVFRAEAPLECSISALGGSDDRRVRRPQLAAWRQHTASAFDLRLFPGDHFFARRDPYLLLQALAQQLTQVARRIPRSRP